MKLFKYLGIQQFQKKIRDTSHTLYYFVSTLQDISQNYYWVKSAKLIFKKQQTTYEYKLFITYKEFYFNKFQKIRLILKDW